MHLPNYFLADLPSEAVLTPQLITEACQTLKRNRQQYLKSRSTQNLIFILSEVARNWLQPEYPFRRMALELGPPLLGFSAGTLGRGLDAFFSQITPETLQALLVQEFGHGQRLDQLAVNQGEQKNRRASHVRGPELLSHITSGNLPTPAVASMVQGLVVRAAQFIKCPFGTGLVPRLFAHSVYESEPKLGSCLEIAEWSREDKALEEALFAETDCLTVTGTDTAIHALRQRVPPRTRFVAYGHRVSFGFISREAVSGYALGSVLAMAVEDVVAWNQLGCLSPHVFYVERGGGASPEEFAEKLGQELAAKEVTEPRGAVPLEISSLISIRRSFYLVRAEYGDTRQWASPDSTSWTVVYESDPRFQISCLHRFIYVKPVANLREALEGADPIREHVSTVGLAVPEEKCEALARELADWGVPRICPLGRMQRPPLTWRHDGRPALADLVSWTDWEQS